MKSLDELGQVISTDVLVIGGGVAGLPAAIKAKEKGNDVLLVDKGGIGWAGQMGFTGAGCMFLQPDDIDKWCQWLAESGEYLNNQENAYAFGKDHYHVIKELGEVMGAPFLKDADGKVALLPYYKNYSYTRYQPRTFLTKLKQYALKRGIKMMDKIFIADLLQNNGKVVGAIGFGILDGKTYVLKAKATVLANGGCFPQVKRAFVATAGEGIQMAFRAGAQLMNAEFGNTFGFGFKLGDVYVRSPMYLFYENSLGERFMGNYYPELMSGLEHGQETENFAKITDAIAKEAAAGRSPIYMDFRKLTKEELEVCLRKERSSPPEYQFVGRGTDIRKFLREKCGADVDKEKLEVWTQISQLGGSLRVDVDCRTTAEGLWGAGDICQLGSGWMGALPPGTFPGWGVSFALVTGFRAGLSAGEYAATKDRTDPDFGEVEQTQKKMLKPLGRPGTVEYHDVIRQTQEVVVPLKYNLHRETGRLKEAIGMIKTAIQSLERIGAKDHHELFRYHQAEAMASCAERTLKSALMREETRGSHRREDFPKRDDKKWLKWIVIEQKEGTEHWFTEPVPIDRYRFKPPGL